MAERRTYFVVAWWLATIPGLAISLRVIGVKLFGDWLRDDLDPKLRLWIALADRSYRGFSSTR